MPRIDHGNPVDLDDVNTARKELIERAASTTHGLLVARPVDLNEFDFMFPELQKDPKNLLVESSATREALIELGLSMAKGPVSGSSGDSTIPAAYTYLGQFIAHDITLEASSASISDLIDPALAPLSIDAISSNLKNLRTGTLDLDSVYSPPAPRDGNRLVVGKVTPLNSKSKPSLRPVGKDDFNDLPREPRNKDEAHDRTALIGDPRNDVNTLLAQLHTAFLRAHNAVVDKGRNLQQARRALRRHYQWMVLNDFLPRIGDPQIVKKVLQGGSRHFKPERDKFFVPLEFTTAAYRFGHSMVRPSYNFNLNFNRSGDPGTKPATLRDLLNFTALSGNIASSEVGTGTDTLPENWIVEWERLVDRGDGRPFEPTQRIDTTLTQVLFKMEDGIAKPNPGRKLAVRNLLRGYLLRIPTGQAVAQAVSQPPLTAAQIQAAVPAEQAKVLKDAKMLDRTPLWFYILAEAAHSGGNHLGTVGTTLVAEVLHTLVRNSAHSYLAEDNWQPGLGKTPGQFGLPDLLRLAGVLT